jgi:hypothetical protein
MDDIGRALGAFAASIVGLAIISVIFSPNSQAANVIGTAGGAFSSILRAATAPVSGGSVAPPINFTGAGGIANLSGLGAFAGGAVSGLLSGLVGGYGGGGGGYSGGGGGGFVDTTSSFA